MDVAYFLEQGLSCLRLARQAENLEVKADLLASARESLQRARNRAAQELAPQAA